MKITNVNSLVLNKALGYADEYDACKKSVSELKRKVFDFAEEHRLSVGLTEIAAGVALVSSGIATGGLLDSASRIPEFLGALSGFGLAGSFGYLLGGIGIAVAGTAFGIPVIAVSAVSALSGSIAGYLGGSAISSILDTEITFLDKMDGAALMAAGLWLIYNGVKRVLRSEGLSKVFNAIKDFFMRIFIIS